MALTDYQVLIFECDGVLVDSDSGLWATLQTLLGEADIAPDRSTMLSRFYAEQTRLEASPEDLGFSGRLCFAHRNLSKALGLEVSWDDSLEFSRTAQNWPLFEDAPGAVQYMRKFYQVAVLSDRGTEDRVELTTKLGLDEQDMFNQGELSDWLAEREIQAHRVLRVSTKAAEPGEPFDLCHLRREQEGLLWECSAPVCADSLADLVSQHQSSLRQS
ncbi:HAD family hydrolase [Pseudomonas sp. XS1P51]